MEIISRKDAKAAGLVRYFTGEPCKFGHVAERNTKTKRCLKCDSIQVSKKISAKRKEKRQEMLASLPEEVNGIKVILSREARKQGLEYYFTGTPCKRGHLALRSVSEQKCVICVKEKTKERAILNKDHNREVRRAWYEKNKEQESIKSKAWFKANAERSKATGKIWVENNREKVNARVALRRAMKLEATPSWLTDSQFQEIETFYDAAQLIGIFSDQSWHVDHIVPLKGKKVRGLHVPWNLQLLSASENSSKGNRMPEALK